MLQVTKNQAVADIAKKLIKVRQMEIDWYTTYYGAMASQAALLAGFGFNQLTEPIPDGSHGIPAPHFGLEMAYLGLSVTTIGLELITILCCTLLSIWGPGDKSFF